MVADDVLEELVQQAAGGDESAWQALWAALEPRLLGLVKQPRVLSRLAEREDCRRDVVLEVMGRLRSDEFRRLRAYLEARDRDARLTFVPWLFVVTKRVAVDYLRATPEYLDRRREAGASTPGKWVQQTSLPPSSLSPGQRPPLTDRAVAFQLVSWAETSLPEDQRTALSLWLQASTFEDIAAKLAVEPKVAERAVRAALERLRRHFREGVSDGS